MMDGLSQSGFEYLGLQSPLQEILNLQSQHVIEPHSLFVQDTNTDKATDKGISFEKSTRIFGLELEQLTSSTTNLGEGEGDTPDFALVLKTVLSNELDINL